MRDMPWITTDRDSSRGKFNGHDDSRYCNSTIIASLRVEASLFVFLSALTIIFVCYIRRVPSYTASIRFIS